MKKYAKVIITESQYKSIMKEVTQIRLTAYHGTSENIEAFTDTFVGGENAVDEQGAGIYFTTNKKEASAYGNKLYTVELFGSFLTDKEPATAVDISKLIQLIKMSEDWENMAYNFDTNANKGAMIASQGAIEYSDTEKEVFQSIEADFYRYDGLRYVRNMVKLGYDGIIVDSYGNKEYKNIIMFNPNNIKIINIEAK